MAIWVPFRFCLSWLFLFWFELFCFCFNCITEGYGKNFPADAPLLETWLSVAQGRVIGGIITSNPYKSFRPLERVYQVSTRLASGIFYPCHTLPSYPSDLWWHMGKNRDHNFRGYKNWPFAPCLPKYWDHSYNRTKDNIRILKWSITNLWINKYNEWSINNTQIYK